MDQRMSLITLGVQDVARARAFYERLGWTASSESQEGCAFFQAGGTVLALYGRADLARDLGQEAGGPPGAGVTLALNVADPAAVESTIAGFVEAGGTLVKPAHKAFWGGTIGFVADPDGFIWEIAFNPFWTFDSRGNVVLPDSARDAS
ncbi:VOC family protein [uncultured Alsobacter sp.]|uniref:VOC family protein n=1 Tax=uncultured Alsobacter sp. TaxID=1748258 RepID=UPI0025FF0649|nr:VOC family protein [uncultured Alsobacter sp.]